MRRAAALGAAPALALALSGCGGDGVLTQINPFAGAAEVDLAGPAAPPGGLPRRADGRGLVERVTALSVEPVPGGAVIEARGLPPVQGFWDVGLVERPAGSGPGAIVYELRVEPPPAARRVGPPASREVVAGAFVPDGRLRGVSSIRVVGVRNGLEARR